MFSLASGFYVNVFVWKLSLCFVSLNKLTRDLSDFSSPQLSFFMSFSFNGIFFSVHERPKIGSSENKGFLWIRTWVQFMLANSCWFHCWDSPNKRKEKMMLAIFRTSLSKASLYLLNQSEIRRKTCWWSLKAQHPMHDL